MTLSPFLGGWRFSQHRRYRQSYYRYGEQHPTQNAMAAVLAQDPCTFRISYDRCHSIPPLVYSRFPLTQWQVSHQPPQVEVPNAPLVLRRIVNGKRRVATSER